MRSFKSVLRSTAVKALQCGPIPKHVGFIMDGNRRYGRKVQVGSGKGYYLGYDTLQEVSLSFSLSQRLHFTKTAIPRADTVSCILPQGSWILMTLVVLL